MPLSEYNSLIETTLAFLGLNPAEAESEEDGQWVVFNGDTEIYIDLWEQIENNGWMYFESDEPIFVFQAISPICYLPSGNLEHFYEELLQNNLNLVFASYTINKEQNILAVKFRRICNGLKQEDIVEAIESIGYYSEITLKALSDRYDIKKIETE
ncbi:MAG: hypothetical protein HQ463_00165 [Bacteroidetes bacterium]|nr:hypothetical protein [Bacteroidota bacterium]